ncbi:MAG: 4'-phosphopantetheinyl transferase family protein [Candidatus Promineifilaceae bacterium]
MKIDWLIQVAADHPQIAAGLAPKGLLSPLEDAVFRRLRTDKRRQDWLLGRWTAKRLLRAGGMDDDARRFPAHALAILAAADGAPELWLCAGGSLHRGSTTVSISHASGIAFCACAGPGMPLLGADIEAVQRRPDGFADQFFSPAEIASLQHAPDADRVWLSTAIWSGKEAVLKAIRVGLRVDTRHLSCLVGGGAADEARWRPFAVSWNNPQWLSTMPPLQGWWRRWHDFILTLAVSGTQPMVDTAQRQNTYERRSG